LSCAALLVARASRGDRARGRAMAFGASIWRGVVCTDRRRRRNDPVSRTRLVASFVTTLSAWTIACSLPASTVAQDCVVQGSVAIFMVYQEENPDAVFFSEDGCLAGGGRGNGCCPGSKCAVCEPNIVQSTSGKQMKWNSCACQPCDPGTVQFRAGRNACEPCPAGWYQRERGKTQCEPCPPGTFNGDTGRFTTCDLCPSGTYSLSDVGSYREATAKLYRAAGVAFDPSAGASRCAACPAGTYQPETGGRSPDACIACPAGYYSEQGASTCEACPSGTYQPFPRQPSAESCLPCAAGACSDDPASVACYQCCPILNLACDAGLKQPAGFYGTARWSGDDGEVGRVPTDKK